MAVAGAEEGEVEDANACYCWSRRSSRGRDGDTGDVVVLDEARRGTQSFLAQGRMIWMMWRQCSKETAKNSYNLTKTMRGARNDEVGDVVDGGEEATAEKTTG